MGGQVHLKELILLKISIPTKQGKHLQLQDLKERQEVPISSITTITTI